MNSDKHLKLMLHVWKYYYYVVQCSTVSIHDAMLNVVYACICRIIKYWCTSHPGSSQHRHHPPCVAVKGKLLLQNF